MNTFCITCGRRTEYKLISNKVKQTIREVSFEYEEITPICMKCGTEVYVPSINDINCGNRLTAYRKAKGE